MIIYLDDESVKIDNIDIIAGIVKDGSKLFLRSFQGFPCKGKLFVSLFNLPQVPVHVFSRQEVDENRKQDNRDQGDEQGIPDDFPDQWTQLFRAVNGSAYVEFESREIFKCNECIMNLIFVPVIDQS